MNQIATLQPHVPQVEPATLSRPTLPPSLGWLRAMQPGDMQSTAISQKTRQALEQSAREYDRYLKPAYAEEILALVTATSNFYFVRAEDDVIGELQGELWLKVLGHLPIHAVAEACAGWLRVSAKKRPTPADLLGRAVDHVRYELADRHLIDQILRHCRVGLAPQAVEENADPWMQARIKAGLRLMRSQPTREQVDELAHQILAGAA